VKEDHGVEEVGRHVSTGLFDCDYEMLNGLKMKSPAHTLGIKKLGRCSK
jgi:hypothetical protein